ncbi:MAG: sterol desaturase family protein [Pseudomonadota bacterium]
MDWLTAALSPRSVADLETQLGTWGSLAFLILFALEMLRLALKKRLTLKIVGDSVASVITFGLFLALTYGLLAASYLSIFYWAYLNFAFTEIAVTPVSVALLVVLCDFAYYWEHRFTHRVGMAWATHSVHHSSPYFNISVAYRFGPMDGVWPLLFHLPLVVAGFDPIVVFACEAFVQLYQTILHTEVIGRLPRPIEAIFNTPSHHRVHHGTNRPYIDKNYGGVFIVWDRLFGTFAEEQESVSYGITEPIDSNNPLTVWLHGFGRLARRSFASTTYADALHSWIAPPEWQPGDRRAGPQGWLVPLSMTALVVIWMGSTPGMAGDGHGRADDPLGVDAPTLTEEQRALLVSTVEDYYARYRASDTERIYDHFADDALFHYRMDFGRWYGTTEFSFRANEPEPSSGAFDDSILAGYEAIDADYVIHEIRMTDSGATAHVYLTESYRWDGYEGTMKARERLHLEIRDGYPTVTRFDSEQIYR